ncbi:hypothetical protein [Serratia rubidaea]|uniref:hypothetical protein n=1 Tax=Serratia rubidaea TaxID=61652 RepID=UPI00130ED33A|nr:hypothetical protein [Serratia rubidaea]
MTNAIAKIALAPPTRVFDISMFVRLAIPADLSFIIFPAGFIGIFQYRKQPKMNMLKGIKNGQKPLPYEKIVHWSAGSTLPERTTPINRILSRLLNGD